MKEKTKENDLIDESNYRQAAKDAVKKYFDTNMIVDAMFWRYIVGLYENDLRVLQLKLERTKEVK